MSTDKVYIQIITDDKGTTKKVGVNAKKLGVALSDVGVSARDSERALKGAARTSSNSTKNFAKMAQGISGGLVPAYAAFAANIFALSAAFEFLKRAANLENLRKGQEDFASSSGIALAAMTQRLQQASDGMLGFEAAAKAAAMGVAKGFTSGQMEKLASGARKVSTALGVDFEDAFDRLVRGVSKAEPELLDELGITLRLETANKKYAASINKSADALTAAERSQATYVETLSQLNSQFGSVKPATNSFVVLGKTFQKVAQDITAKLLPALEGLATFLSNNADAALTAFAALGVMILSSMSGFSTGVKFILGGVASGIGKVGGAVSTKIGKAADNAVTNLDKISNKLDQIESEIAGTRQSAASAADKILETQPKSKIIKKIAQSEEIGGLDRKNLEKAMASAEKQYRDFGKVTKGIFAGVTEDVYRDFKKKFNDIDNKVLTKFDKAVRYSTEKASNGFKRVGRVLSFVSNNADVATKKVKRFGQVGSKAFVWLGVITALVETFSQLISAPDQAAKSVINMVVGIVKAFEFIIDAAIRGINALLSLVGGSGNTIEFRMGSGFGEDGKQGMLSQYAEGFSTGAMNILTGTTEKQRKEMEASNAAALALAETEKNRKEQFAAIGTSMRAITKDVTSGGFVEGMARANAFSSLGLSGAIGSIQDEKDPGLRKALTEDLRKKLLEGGLAKLGKGFEDAVITALMFGKPEELKRLESAGAAYGGAISSLKDQVTNFKSSVTSGDATGAKLFIEDMLNSESAAGELAKTLKITSEAGEIIQDVFKDQGGAKAFLAQLIKTEKEFEALADARLSMNIAATKDVSLTTIQATKAAKLREIETARLNVQETMLEIQSTLNARSINMQDHELDANKKKEKALRRQLALQESQVDAAEKAGDAALKMALDINNALEKTLSSEIGDLIKGKRTSLTDAMKAIAKSALDALIDNFSQNLVEDLDIFGGDSKAAKLTAAVAEGGIAAGQTIKLSMISAATEIGAVIGSLGALKSKNSKGVSFEERESAIAQLFNTAGGRASLLAKNIKGTMSSTVESPGGQDVTGGINEITVTGQRNITATNAPYFQHMGEMLENMRAIMIKDSTVLEKIQMVGSEFLHFIPDLFFDLKDVFLRGLRAISSALGSTDIFKTIGTFLGFADGGIHSRGRRMGGYSTGGIAKGAKSGYPAMLHGTEAIVPLPNGKSIPVHMKGGAANISNITVNIASDGSTNASGSTGGDSQQQLDIGRAIAQAVKEELQRQKRSGGILSRYGAAGGM